MAAEVAQLSVVIKADTKQAEEGLSRTSDKVKETGGGFKEALGHIGEFAGASLLVNGVTSAVSFLKDNLTEMVSSGMDANRMDALLAQGLRSTHDASGMTSDSLDALSTKLMNLTGIDDDSVKGAEQMLLTFTNIGKDVFPLATQAAADLATRMNNGVLPNAQQLSQVSIQLGKALNDPIKGISALQRVGVTFTDQQKEQIKQMMAAGNVAGAQKIILAELNKEFGGSAEAAGQANGGIAILAAQFDNFKQTIGQAIIPILTALLQAIMPITASLMNDLPGALKTVQGVFNTWAPVLQYAWQTLQQLGQIITVALKPAFDTLSKAFDDVGKGGLSTSGVMNTINQVFNAVVGVINQFAPVLDKLAQWFVSTGLPAFKQLANFFITVWLPVQMQFVGFLVANVLPALGNLANWIITKVLPAVEQMQTWFAQKVVPILEQVVKIIVDNVVPTLEGIGNTIMSQLLPALEGLWNAISPALIPVLGFLGGVLQNVVGPAINIVINLVALLINGITGIIQVVGTVLGAIGDFVGGILGFFGNLFDELIGHSIIPDLINGIVTWFTSLPGKVLGLIGTMVGNLLGTIGSMKDQAIALAMKLATDFVGPGGIGGLPAQLLTLAGQMLDGLIQGILGGAANVLSTVKDFAGSIVDGIKGVLGIHSPSTVFAGIGADSASGYAQGLRDNAGKASDAAQSVANAATNSMKSKQNLDNAYAAGQALSQALADGSYSVNIQEDINANINAAQQGQTGGTGGQHSKHFAGGGLIPEPVVGYGTRSGTLYTFAENGPEMVVPNGHLPNLYASASGSAASASGGAPGSGSGVYIASGTSLVIPLQVNGRVFTQVLLPDLVSAIREGAAIRHM